METWTLYFPQKFKVWLPDKPKILCTKFAYFFQVAWYSLNFNGLWEPVSRSDKNKPRHLDNIERIMTPLKTTEWEKNNRNFAKDRSINRNKDISFLIKHAWFWTIQTSLVLTNKPQGNITIQFIDIPERTFVSCCLENMNMYLQHKSSKAESITLSKQVNELPAAR